MAAIYKSAKINVDNVFEGWEERVLEKYRDWNKVDSEDKAVLNRVALIGAIQHEFNFDEMYPIAKLTSLGERLIN